MAERRELFPIELSPEHTRLNPGTTGVFKKKVVGDYKLHLLVPVPAPEGETREEMNRLCQALYQIDFIDFAEHAAKSIMSSASRALKPHLEAWAQAADGDAREVQHGNAQRTLETAVADLRPRVAEPRVKVSELRDQVKAQASALTRSGLMLLQTGLDLNSVLAAVPEINQTALISLVDAEGFSINAKGKLKS